MTKIGSQPTQQRQEPQPPPSNPLGSSSVAQLALLVPLFFVFAAEPAPSVNETHYTLKAVTYWMSGPLKNDIFLGSADTHWLFFALFGLLGKFFSLSATAWVIRITGWIALAFGWQQLCRPLKLPGLATVLLAAIWVALSHWCQLSGEWVVGGGEAKVFAYALAMVGIGQILDGKLERSWIWFGASSALHVLVGGWCVLLAAFNLLLATLHKTTPGNSTPIPWKKHAIGLILGGTISLAGLIPALRTTAGVDPQVSQEAAEIYVFKRLPHHLCFSKFPLHRKLAFLVPLTGLALGSWLALRHGLLRTDQSTASGSTQQQLTQEQISSKFRISQWVSASLCLAWGSVVLVAIGIAIEQLTYALEAKWGASLLKYYWFRLADPLVPLGAILSLLGVIEYRKLTAAPEQLPTIVAWERRWIIASLLLTSFVFGERFQTLIAMEIPEAEMRTLAIANSEPAEQKQVYQDWRAACRWISKNTEPEGLWLTPRHQQSFKWHTQRAEFACWKDVPQDSASMMKWWNRFRTVYKSVDGQLQPWNAEQLLAWGEEHNIRYVLVDRRIQKDPPSLSMIYPIAGEFNSHYAIFELPTPKKNTPTNQRDNQQGLPQ